MSAVSPLYVGHAAWVIQDGNYPDWYQGERVRFAIHLSGSIELSKGSEPCYRHIAECSYDVIGRVLWTWQQGRERGWIADVGGIHVYSERQLPEGVGVGACFQGRVNFTVDYYWYFEVLSKQVGVVPAIYDWVIEDIMMETAPFIDARDPAMPNRMVRDPSKRERVSRDRTDACKDDEGRYGDYLLTCVRLPGPPAAHL